MNDSGVDRFTLHFFFLRQRAMAFSHSTWGQRRNPRVLSLYLTSTLSARHLNLLKMHGRSKKNENLKIISNGGPRKVSEMMRGFQIWPQNSNRITYDLPFGQKTRILGFLKTSLENPKIRQFFFYKKGVECYPIWILRPDMESSHHFWYLRPQFQMIFKFSFFDLTCIFKKF